MADAPEIHLDVSSDFSLACFHLFQACSEGNNDHAVACLDVLFGQCSPLPATSDLVATEVMYEAVNLAMRNSHTHLFSVLLRERCGMLMRILTRNPHLTRRCRPIYRSFFRNAALLGALPMLDVLYATVQQDHAAVVRQQGDVKRADTVIRGCFGAALHGAIEADKPEVLTWLAALPGASMTLTLDFVRYVFETGSARFMETLLVVFPGHQEDIVNVGCNTFYAACISLRTNVVQRFCSIFLPMVLFRERVGELVARAKRSVLNMMKIPVEEDPAFKAMAVLLDQAFPDVGALA